jgi:Ca2+-binding RTX toxin-like protein
VFLARATDVAGNVSAIAGQNGSVQFGSTLDDVIKSTIGNDIMTGGAGNDTFAFLSDFGKDVIKDFNAGSVASHDTIDFHSNSILNNAANVLRAAKQVGSDTVITSGSNTLTLVNVVEKSLIAADFTFV